MKGYTVVWDPDLEADFTRFWTQSDSSLRAVLTHASNWIDQNLGVDPQIHGRPSAIDPTYRVLVVPGTEAYPLVVLYRVIPEDRQVVVLGIQHPLNQ